MGKAKILVVDDDLDILNLLRDNLEGREYLVRTADNGDVALKIFQQDSPDLLILDIMMPWVDGLRVCRTVRQNSDIPILFLTAKTQLADKLEGFDLGATDYITKPFHILELVARVKAALRAYKLHKKQQVLIFGELKVDIEGSQAYRGDQRLSLSRTELEILKCLALHTGKTVTRDFLLETVWGYDETVVSRTLDSFIRNLRQKIEADPHRPRLIKTVHGIGYRLEWLEESVDPRSPQPNPAHSTRAQ